MKITLKLATSLDGRIALHNGQSQWITSAESRAKGHALRAEHDAILAGINTAIVDDPLLTARTIPVPKKQPIRIIADSRARLSTESRLARTTNIAPVLLVTTANMDKANAALLSAMGVEIIPCYLPSAPGRVDIGLLLDTLRTMGVQSLLVEGGGTIAASFIKENWVTNIEWFIAPMIIGADGLAGIGPLNIDTLSQASHWRAIETCRSGVDIHVSYQAI